MGFFECWLERVGRAAAWVVVTPFLVVYRVLDWAQEKIWNS